MKPKAQSRTLRTAGLIAVLGVVVESFPLLKDTLGDHYGIAFILISGIFAYLRTVTTEPVK